MEEPTDEQLDLVLTHNSLEDVLMDNDIEQSYVLRLLYREKMLDLAPYLEYDACPFDSPDGDDPS